MNIKTKLRLGAVCGLIIAVVMFRSMHFFDDYKHHVIIGSIMLFFLCLHMLLLPGAYVGKQSNSDDSNYFGGYNDSDGSGGI